MLLLLPCWVVLFSWFPVHAHDGHEHPNAPGPGHHHPSIGPEVPGQDDGIEAPPTEDSEKATTGSGRYTFRHRPIEIPEAMQEHLQGAHGGFAVDSEADGGDGSTYFSLKGVGLLRLGPQLDEIEVLGGDPALTAVNLHNTCLFRESGKTYLALPSDEGQKAFLASTDGALVRTFPNPYGDERAFRVCDLEYVDGLLFAPNGYADNVVFATNPFSTDPDDERTGTWESLRFGGKGEEHGKFGTAHGITRVPGSNVFTIADRANSRLETYTTEGRYIAGVALPEGCLPCDTDYHGDLTLVGCLRGPGNSTPAPIYILEKGNLVAELNIGRDLGLEGFTHIHNAAFRVVKRADGTEQLFVLAYAWNPGNFAVLEQVME